MSTEEINAETDVDNGETEKRNVIDCTRGTQTNITLCRPGRSLKECFLFYIA